MDDSRFLLPFTATTIRKAGEQWEIYIEASNEYRDRENEIVLQAALVKAAPKFLEIGKVSWNHLHKDKHGQERPSFVVGHPLDVRFIEERPKRTLVKAKLYRTNKVAQEIMANMEGGCDRFGASIGGQKLAKSFSDGTVSAVVWDEVAITYDPINLSTSGAVQLNPMEEFAKALMAGAGINPAEFTSGRVITREEMEGQQKELLNEVAMGGEQYKKAFIYAVHFIKDNPMYDDSELVRSLVENGYGVEVAQNVCEYVNKNLNKAQHVLCRGGDVF